MITIIIEYVLTCTNQQVSEYASGTKICQSSEYGRVLHMRTVHSVQNIPEHAFTEF